MATRDDDALRKLLGEIETENDDLKSVLESMERDLPTLIEEGYESSGTLAERFGVPPFSVLDARQGYWQDRKRSWLDLGIESEAGRRDNLMQHSVASSLGKLDTSTFDPVLCELVYSWFSCLGSSVIDPFSGGSVRGVVASKLGRRYFGVDLRAEQVEANRKQAESICEEPLPEWIVGDSCQDLPDDEFDLVFSCPPYFDLEVYGEDERDLSNAGSYEVFIESYRTVIRESCSRLRNDRFACFVVGEIRDSDGFYRGFVRDTLSAFLDCGMRSYNDAVLVTALGSLPMRSAIPFEKSRKLGKTHQNVLIFCKGDPVAATEWAGDCDFGTTEEGDSLGL